MRLSFTKTMYLILFLCFSILRGFAQVAPDPWVTEVLGPQYFAVMVRDAEKSADWYSSVFDLQKVNSLKATDNSWQIENLKNEKLFVEIIRDDRASETERALGFWKVGFFVSDLVSIANKIETETGSRPRIIEIENQGLQIMQIKDPDNNTIQLMAPLASEKK